MENKEDKTKEENKEEKTEEMKIPKGEDMVNKWIAKVSVSNIELDVYLTDERMNPNAGQIFLMKDKIYICKYLPPQQQLIVLVHEILHAMMGEYQIHNLEEANPYKMVELIVGALDAPITNDILLSPINTQLFSRVLKGEFSEDVKKG